VVSAGNVDSSTRKVSASEYNMAEDPDSMATNLVTRRATARALASLAKVMLKGVMPSVTSSPVAAQE
jgi:hypothetical protein